MAQTFPISLHHRAARPRHGVFVSLRRLAAPPVSPTSATNHLADNGVTGASKCLAIYQTSVVRVAIADLAQWEKNIKGPHGIINYKRPLQKEIMFIPRQVNGSASYNSGFLSDYHVRRQWIAFFVLWLLWGFTWFVRHAFPGSTRTAAPGDRVNAVDADADASAANTTVPATGTHSKWGLGGSSRYSGDGYGYGGIAGRGNRAHDVLRDLVLLLLSALLVNTLAQGSTYAVEILAWIFVAFAIVWTIFEASYESRIARFFFGLVFFGITVAIFSLAFHEGWDD
ncbi:hypothetical protein BC936DRAFT_138600 [Jimgerdemannia flammicorona]|uniref:Uncharacterized protein n=1 Tax=Jimgerdemannia flammicorona TaxID=994334 RepID=A0A433C054_9FUNG|nr:hypothetical protein BC936DRAFT_138600 [Jimgerdemannia flammicorona]